MPSWAALGQLLGALGRLLAPHGHFLGAPGARLVLSWASLGWSVASPEWVLPSRDPPGLDFWRFWDVPSWVLEGFRNMLCMLFAAPRTLLHNAFIDAVTTLLHLLALFLLPFWCGGLCTAHGIDTSKKHNCCFANFHVFQTLETLKISVSPRREHDF